VDFFWPDLGLIVETDHGQVRYEPAYVLNTLAAVARL
jgi:hypothetical protein